MNDLEKQIEGYLFFVGEPVNKEDLAEIFSVTTETLAQALEQLSEQLKERGIVLIETHESVSLGTHPSLGPLLEKIQKEALNKDLTKVALETLSVILYHENPSRSDIDYIRGVNSQFSIRALLMRGLIERLPHPTDNRKFIYTPTPLLLEFLGVSKVSDLSNYQSVTEAIKAKLTKQEEAAKE